MMNQFSIIERGNPRLMEPLSCRHAVLDLEMGAGSLRSTLADRWSGLLMNGASLEVKSDFWPSDALLAQLAKVNAGFIVKDENGEIAAERKTCNDSSAEFQADETSFLIRYPWDILKVNEQYLLKFKQSRYRGTVREGATVDGVLILGEGSIVLPGVYIEGTAIVGKNCKIGPNCYLRGSNYIGDECHIGQAVEIKNSILMYHVAAGHLSYIGDSIVCPKTNFGAGTITSNFRHDGKNHRSMVNHELVDTGRRKFGSIIGDNVHTGIHTAIYPGRKIWPDMQTLPGGVVKYDLTADSTK